MVGPVSILTVDSVVSRFPGFMADSRLVPDYENRMFQEDTPLIRKGPITCKAHSESLACRADLSFFAVSLLLPLVVTPKHAVAGA